jgi:putative membrane protein
MSDGPRTDPSTYLAAERTFLAWIRTGLALMGFGFVVARFGLFLREIAVAQKNLPPRSFSVSLWFGVALVAIGVGVNIAAAFHHVQLVRALQAGSFSTNRPSKLAIAVALMLAFVGAIMAIYLIFVR